MLPSQLFLLPAFGCNLERHLFPLFLATYFLFQCRNCVPLCLLLGHRVDSLFLLQRLSWVCNHDAVVPLSTDRDLCFFVFWTAARSASRVAAWNPRDNPARRQIAWNCFSPTLPMNPLEEQRQASRLHVCSWGRQHMWRVDNCMLECLFYSDMSSCAFNCVCEGWRKRLKRFQFN